jgi:hypothetical protein
LSPKNVQKYENFKPKDKDFDDYEKLNLEIEEDKFQDFVNMNPELGRKLLNDP